MGIDGRPARGWGVQGVSFDLYYIGYPIYHDMISQGPPTNGKL